MEVSTPKRPAEVAVASSAGPLLMRNARLDRPKIQTATDDNGRPYTFIELEDGRHLAFEKKGDPKGAPVILLHGSPGSRIGPHPRTSTLRRQGILFLSYDRPGYGYSTPNNGRQIADCVDEVHALVKALGIKRFGILGRSGGGPGALACAAAADTFDGRLQGVIAVGTLTPRPDRFKGVARSNEKIYGNGEQAQDEQALIDELTGRVEGIRENPSRLLEELEPELTPPDMLFTHAPDTRALLEKAYAEAVRQGAVGWIQDALAVRNDWGFDLNNLYNTPVPVRFWHAGEDQYSPLEPVEKLADSIKNASLEVVHGLAHFGGFRATPQLLARLADPKLPYWSAEQPKRTDYGYHTDGYHDRYSIRSTSDRAHIPEKV